MNVPKKPLILLGVSFALRHLALNAPWSDRTANMAHISCLRFAQNVLPRITARGLCQIAWHLRPVFAWRHVERLTELQPSLTYFPRSVIRYDTDLGALVRLVMRLPPEIEEMICALLPSDLFTSLSNCLSSLDWLLKNNKYETKRLPEPSSRYFSENKSPPRLKIGINVLSVLGETCLEQIGTDPNSTYGQSVEVLDQKVKGVQFALKTYGVVALRILYEDGFESAWLGQQQPQR